MRYDDCKCKKENENLMPMRENVGARFNPNCNMTVRRQLEPVLVAKIYYQPIVEEIPNSAMSLTMDNTATITSACTEIKPMCECGCDDGYMGMYWDK